MQDLSSWNQGLNSCPWSGSRSQLPRKSILQTPSWCQYAFSQRESPGMTFPRDICLWIPLSSVPIASTKLQICRTSCFHAWFPGLPACFEHAKVSLSPGTEHDFLPTVFPTLWIYNNMQGKQHLLLEKLPDSPPSCSGLHAHLLFFYTSSVNLSEAISPAISSSAYLCSTLTQQ